MWGAILKHSLSASFHNGNLYNILNNRSQTYMGLDCKIDVKILKLVVKATCICSPCLISHPYHCFIESTKPLTWNIETWKVQSMKPIMVFEWYFAHRIIIISEKLTNTILETILRNLLWEKKKIINFFDNFFLFFFIRVVSRLF